MIDSSSISKKTLDEMKSRSVAEGYPFLFSVVIAIFNAEEYLEEAIESLVNQSVGFDCIQVILANDGSTDGSADICNRFVQQFPNNIIYVPLQHQGVSATRNSGILKACGKYINFLDADDKWSENSFADVAVFFHDHPNIKLAASKIVMFDAKKGGHRLNYKFAKTQVINLIETYDYPQLSAASCFFESSLFGNHYFSDRLSVSEDVLLVNQILLEELCYGVLSKPTYYYRQRKQLGSTIDTMKENTSWYLDTPVKCYEALFGLSKQQHGVVLPFIQFTVMYDLQWRIRAKKPSVLDDIQLLEYRKSLERLLCQIDDHIISEQRTISIDYVAFALCLKYGTTLDDVLDHLVCEDNCLKASIIDRTSFKRVITLRKLDTLSDYLCIESIEVLEQSCLIKGFIKSFRFRPKDLMLEIATNNKPAKVELFTSGERKLRNPFDENSIGKTGFTCAFPLLPNEEVCIRSKITVQQSYKRNLRFLLEGYGSETNSFVEGDFAIFSNATIIKSSPDCITIRRHGKALSETEISNLCKQRDSYKNAVSKVATRSNKAQPWKALK